ncbi:unnamed protein product [Echinostoma caproni]|uniref:Late endosomal/lysosomal adaptor and MAPK and MTOR activator 5 n=1 Tax=Echinostoma caproni TaxID=27848 RepID=A0A183AJU7_9TREM|nr:unnamed protein product [Echinostoma caproni]
MISLHTVNFDRSTTTATTTLPVWNAQLDLSTNVSNTSTHDLFASPPPPFPGSYPNHGAHTVYRADSRGLAIAEKRPNCLWTNSAAVGGGGGMISGDSVGRLLYANEKLKTKEKLKHSIPDVSKCLITARTDQATIVVVS